MLGLSIALFVLWSIVPVMTDQPVLPSTRVVARDGSLLYEVPRPTEGLRTLVKLERIPSSLQQAVLLTEDARFYHHHGVDVLAIARATKDAIRAGRPVGGASTIEQQLIKNSYFLGRPRTVLQKMREGIAAIYWSFTHSKAETLERYLNTIPLGNQTYGVQAAATRYFRKDVADLSVADGALLAGIIAAPSAYDPYLRQGAARTRQRMVLERLLEKQLISQEVHDQAKSDALALFPRRFTMKAPYVVFRVLEEARQKWPDVEEGGYVIKTTIDPLLQQAVEVSVSRRLVALIDEDVHNAAVIAAEARTGQVLAYVGNADYFDDAHAGQIDMAIVPRQPGSALKPFLYFAAFLRGYAPASVIADTPVRFETADGKPYYPRNYSHRYYGPVSLRDALGSSLNIPAVKILNEIGLPTFMNTLAQFGLTFPESPDHYGLGLVLGGGEVTLWDLVQAYGIFARQGDKVPLTLIDEVRLADQRVVFSSPMPPKSSTIGDEQARLAIGLVTDVLADPAARRRSFGEASILNLSPGIAVKTGTTKDFHDNWAMGYSSDFVVGVWVGNADQTPMRGVSGVSGAVPIWVDVMRARFGRDLPKKFERPVGLVEQQVCSTSGLLASAACPKTRTEVFISGTQPTKIDDWYIRCGSEVYLHPPVEYAGWMADAGYPSRASADCAVTMEGDQSRLTILSPLDGDTFEIDPQIGMAYQGISFVAGGRATKYRWTLNGQVMETADATYVWEPRPGDYTLKLENSDRQIQFTVQ